MIYDIDPVPKPRRFIGKAGWQIRKNHPKYWAFTERAKLLKIQVPDSGAIAIFNIKMPTSWTMKKREVMRGQPHQQKPDIDNLCKALLDAVYDDDKVVWNISLMKLWDIKGSIEILEQGVGNAEGTENSNDRGQA